MAPADRPTFTDRSFRFLAELEENNNAPWFNANKTRYTESLRDPFAHLLETLTERLSQSEQPLAGSARTMFRMNRDVRFSADKRPYKTAVSGLLTPSGTKDEDAGLVYLHLDVDGGFVAGGLHHPTPQQLAPARDHILARPQEFTDLVGRLHEAGLSLDDEDSLKAMPRGYSTASDHPLAWALRLKSWIVVQPLPKVAWTSGDVVDRVEDFVRGIDPLLRFVRATLGSTPAATNRR